MRTDWTETDKAGQTTPREMCEQNFTIPAELQETLLDFTVHYLVEKPPDIIDFAMDFFSRLQAKRNNSQLQNSEDEDMESEEEVDFGKFTDISVSINMWAFSFVDHQNQFLIRKSLNQIIDLM